MGGRLRGASYGANMGRRIAAVVFALGCATAVACANGVADLEDGGFLGEEDASTPSGDSATPPRDAALPPVVQPDSAPPIDDAGSDAPVVGDGGDGGTTSDGGTPTACASPNACLGATTMTGVSGDTGSPTSTKTGSTSQWLQIRVSEDNSSLFDGAKLKLKLTLTSPSSANFDMRVYVPNDGSSQKCTGADRATNATVGPDVASVEWGEGLLPNGNDDDRTVTVEVFNVSGTCAAGQTWSLLAEGNK